MVISPTFPFSRVISSSRSSRSCSFSVAAAANKARSRHCDNRAAVTLSSRASSSSGSPRSRRLTARSFRFAEKRCGGGPAADLSPPARWGRSDNSAGSVVAFSIIPSIRLSFPCGPFNRKVLSICLVESFGKSLARRLELLPDLTVRLQPFIHLFGVQAPAGQNRVDIRSESDGYALTIAISTEQGPGGPLVYPAEGEAMVDDATLLLRDLNRFPSLRVGIGYKGDIRLAETPGVHLEKSR